MLRIAAFLAIALLLITLVNASWLANPPPGRIKLVAHRAAAQTFDRTGVDNGTCTAKLIEPPHHDYLENSVRSIIAARNLGADMVEMDIAPTADGKIAIFHDADLGCRTNGTGAVAGKTLAELQQLDIGHGYSADGGKTFPLRGRTKDRIPSLQEAIFPLPRTPVMFNFKSNDPAEADLLADALIAAGRDPAKSRDAFYGGERPVDRIRNRFPKSWAWSVEGAKRCTRDYLITGWTTFVPDSCRNGTLIVPLNAQWAFAGWPNRLMQRMAKVGARVIVTGPYKRGQPNTGLTLPEQLGKIPDAFNGYVWVEDIYTVGPALKPKWDIRSRRQQLAAEAALERRRHRGD